MEQEEYFFNCPYCGADISMLIDLSASGQDYIEDCEVCCHPIKVSYTVEEGHIADFEASRSE